jgi:hypothetical protein
MNKIICALTVLLSSVPAMANNCSGKDSVGKLIGVGYEVADDGKKILATFLSVDGKAVPSKLTVRADGVRSVESLDGKLIVNISHGIQQFFLGMEGSGIEAEGLVLSCQGD